MAYEGEKIFRGRGKASQDLFAHDRGSRGMPQPGHSPALAAHAARQSDVERSRTAPCRNVRTPLQRQADLDAAATSARLLKNADLESAGTARPYVMREQHGSEAPRAAAAKHAVLGLMRTLRGCTIP